MEDEDSSEDSHSDRDEKFEEFDTIVGHIEDVLVDEKFRKLIDDFMETNRETFEDVEENKFAYSEIFNEYTITIESYIEDYLASKIPSFSMENFFQILEANKDTLEGEVFEVLFTLSDFPKFKETMLDYRNTKEKQYDDLNLTDCVKCLSKKID